MAQAQLAPWEIARVVADPGGCTALAAVLSGRYPPDSVETVAIVVSGPNTAATAVDFTSSFNSGTDSRTGSQRGFDQALTHQNDPFRESAVRVLAVARQIRFLRPSRTT